MFAIALKGAMIGGGLIVAIGAQNAFVLRQGLIKQHIFVVATICFLCDCVLMTLGVLGLGSMIATNQTASTILSILGAIFLIWYGWRSFRSAFQAQHDSINVQTHATFSGSLKKTIATTFAITLLNPHVYLDALVLIGGVSSSLQSHEKTWFLLGALSMSFVWFFALGYGARLLKPVFANPRAWQILECLIGMMMWWLAYGLLRHVLPIFQAA